MKNIKYFVLLLQCFLIATSSAYAKKRQVDEEKIIKEIWARTDMPEFNNREIDEKYKNEPAVGLAVYEEIEVNSGFVYLPVSSLERYLIKLNSANAVERYSEIEYRNNYYGKKTYVGVRIIKQDGTVTELNPNDYIKLDSNTKKKKQKKDYTKIAVPNLQVGDIIDYFVYSSYTIYYDSYIDKNHFYNHRYPVQNYRFKGTFNEKVKVRYTNSDKTAKIKQTTNNKMRTIEVTQTNIDKLKQSSYNSIREIPMLSVYCQSYSPYCTKEYNKKILGITEVKEEDQILNELVTIYNHKTIINPFLLKVAKKTISKHFKANPGLSDAQKADDIYNLLCYLSFHHKEIIPAFAVLLTKYKIDKSIFFTTDRYSQSRDYTTNPYQYIIGVQVKTNGKIYIDPYNKGFDYHYMPSIYDGSPEIDGEKAFEIECKKEKIRIDKKAEVITSGKDIVLPIRPATENKTLVKIDAKLLNGDNSSQMDVTREMNLYGTAQVEARYVLFPYWKYREEFMRFYGIDKSFVRECKDFKIDPRSITKAEIACDEDEHDKKKAYEKEAKMYFRGDVKDVRNFKILSYGVTRKDSILKYKSTATVEDMVMTAGKDKVVSIGRLLYDGSNTRLNAEEEHGNIYRSKTYLDSYEINIAIPNGFTAKDITSLNQEIKNECGMFKSTAQLLGSNLKITVDYENANVYFDKSKWSDMVKIINAYKAFRESSIVLKAQ